MCNLYRMTKAPDEIAHLFGAIADPRGNAGGEVYPGYPGHVVAEGRVRTMNWGFPLKLKGKSGQQLKPKPINNARADKVMTEACIHVADVHDRMPVILRRDDWADWLDGPPDAAGLLCRPYPDLMVVNRTADPWVRRGARSG